MRQKTGGRFIVGLWHSPSPGCFHRFLSGYASSYSRPKDIPTNPQHVYSEKGWQGYGHWLGTGNVNPRYGTVRLKSTLTMLQHPHNLLG